MGEVTLALIEYGGAHDLLRLAMGTPIGYRGPHRLWGCHRLRGVTLHAALRLLFREDINQMRMPMCRCVDMDEDMILLFSDFQTYNITSQLMSWSSAAINAIESSHNCVQGRLLLSSVNRSLVRRIVGLSLPLQHHSITT